MKPRSQIPPAPPLFATLLLPRFPTVSVMSRLVASVESCPSTADVMPLSYDREASCDDGKGAWHAEVQRYWQPVRNCRIQPEPDDRPLTAPHAAPPCRIPSTRSCPFGQLRVPKGCTYAHPASRHHFVCWRAGRTITTGQAACRTQCSLTDPRSISTKAPRPRLPTTSTSAS